MYTAKLDVWNNLTDQNVERRRLLIVGPTIEYGCIQTGQANIPESTTS